MTRRDRFARETWRVRFTRAGIVEREFRGPSDRCRVIFGIWVSDMLTRRTGCVELERRRVGAARFRTIAACHFPGGFAW
jgi:hypothetical protein